MKFLVYAAFVLTAVAESARHADTESVIEKWTNKMLDKMERETGLEQYEDRIELICPGYNQTFEVALQDMDTCYENLDNENETLCSSIRTSIENCSRPLIKMFEKCLPEKLRDIPSLVRKTLLSVQEYLCYTNGEHIFELANPCIFTSNLRFENCIRNLHHQMTKYEKTLPSTAEICRNSRQARLCLHRHVNTVCHNTITQEAFLNLFDAFVSPCKRYLETEVIQG